jgi:predicted small integral membrane protein
MKKYSSQKILKELSVWFSDTPPYFIDKDFIGVVIFRRTDNPSMFIALCANDYIKMHWSRHGEKMKLWATAAPSIAWAEKSFAIGFADSYADAERLILMAEAGPRKT